MNYRFHPEAEAEFREAIEYYEEHKQGLGFDFALEVHSAIEQTLGFPNAWPALEEGVRRCLIRRFPYGILYSVEEDGIYILAVMHLHRNPEYWKHRI